MKEKRRSKMMTIPQNKVEYDRIAEEIYRATLEETNSAKEFNVLYEQRIKVLAKKYGVSVE